MIYTNVHTNELKRPPTLFHASSCVDIWWQDVDVQKYDKFKRKSKMQSWLTCACVVFDTTGAAILYETKLLLRMIDTNITPAVHDSRLFTTVILLGIIFMWFIYGFVMLYSNSFLFLVLGKTRKANTLEWRIISERREKRLCVVIIKNRSQKVSYICRVLRPLK